MKHLFKHDDRNGRVTERVIFDICRYPDKQPSLTVRLDEVRHGISAAVMPPCMVGFIPRDRVPDLIAALQRFMEETKP